MTYRRSLAVAVVAALMIALAPSVFAQGRRTAAEGIAGYAGFIDDSTIRGFDDSTISD